MATSSTPLRHIAAAVACRRANDAAAAEVSRLDDDARRQRALACRDRLARYPLHEPLDLDDPETVIRLAHNEIVHRHFLAYHAKLRREHRAALSARAGARGRAAGRMLAAMHRGAPRARQRRSRVRRAASASRASPDPEPERAPLAIGGRS